VQPSAALARPALLALLARALTGLARAQVQEPEPEPQAQARAQEPRAQGQELQALERGRACRLHRRPTNSLPEPTQRLSRRSPSRSKTLTYRCTCTSFPP
jgi:hypothetical protein